MKLISIFFILALLAGCSHIKEFIPVAAPTEITCGPPPVVDPFVPAKVTIKVVQDKLGLYWVALSAKDYENMSFNEAETNRLVQQKNAVVGFYVRCIDDFNAQGQDDSK